MSSPTPAPVRRSTADVGVARERLRQRRLVRVALWLSPLLAWLTWRAVIGAPALPRLPYVDPMYVIVGLFFVVLLVSLVGMQLVARRSPHVTYRPEQIDVRLDDVKGLGPVRDEVSRTLDLFLAGRSFRDELGGTPRRGVLFEGPPGTGKTYTAKALAKEAGVPFLFVSATSFQSMYYGATAGKIRSYFAALRKAARAEGGAIGFIEEIDAIATVRGGMSATPAPAGLAPAVAPGSAAACCGGLEGLPGAPGNQVRVASAAEPAGLVRSAAGMTSEGVGGVVNELLVQMQSFDTPSGWEKLLTRLVDACNLLLPEHRQIRRPRTTTPDVLLIAATNRADNLDPALLRPGRFDRRLSFDAPDKAGRREIVDFYLDRKAHTPDLDDPERRDALCGVTQGYTPVMIENLLDEALVNAVKRGARAMTWADVEQARLLVEVGLGHPVGYTEHEKRLIATHEAGHATVAWLVAAHRRLEILTIVKRASALGLLAHGDRDDVYTRSRHELEGLVQIAMGGQVAEELFFDDVSTGPGGDLLYATDVAAQMVGAAGMGDSLVSLAGAGGGPFGGSLTSRVLGDREARTEVDRLLHAQKARTRGLLAANRHLVAALRDALLERHELIGHEITDVLEAAARTGEPEPVRVVDLRHHRDAREPAGVADA
ncbi:AAA family ATPase [Aquipuribacter nitratireducens]|uniref:AAA family ATPase n=1 Tax=Aquipuribacter nitratireducens TaxID=650104 RepID=A0ABW0GNE1_9MICO